MAAAGGRIVLSTNIGRRCVRLEVITMPRAASIVFLCLLARPHLHLSIFKANTDWRLNNLKAWQSSVTFHLYA